MNTLDKNFKKDSVTANIRPRIVKGDQKKRSFFKNTLAFLKCFFYWINLLGVKEKVLGIEPRKILTPVPGLKDAYSLSYAIFRETQYDYDFTIYCEMKKCFPLLILS